MGLTSEEREAREMLIAVAQGTPLGKRSGLISYKELWLQLSDRTWGQNRTSDIVALITPVSAFEIAHGRPPLNELVVPKKGLEPNEPWPAIKNFLQDKFRVLAPYNSHREAQDACWRYWTTHQVTSKGVRALSTNVPSHEAEEGFARDRTATFRSRNAKLIKLCKERDKSKCRVCGFRLKVSGRFIVDCHHINQLAHRTEPTVTSLDDLVCLCPTCHRIAHTSRYPLSVDEIRDVRKMR